MKFKTKKDDCPNVRKVKYNTLESSYIFVTPLHLLITKAHNNRLFGDIDEWDFQDNTNERNNLLWKKIFNIFMKYGGDVNGTQQSKEYKKTPLMLSLNHTKLIFFESLLLEENINLNLQDDEGNTILNYLFYKEFISENLIDRLFKLGAKIMKNNMGETVLVNVIKRNCLGNYISNIINKKYLNDLLYYCSSEDINNAKKIILYTRKIIEKIIKNPSNKIDEPNILWTTYTSYEHKIRFINTRWIPILDKLDIILTNKDNTSKLVFSTLNGDNHKINYTDFTEEIELNQIRKELNLIAPIDIYNSLTEEILPEGNVILKPIQYIIIYLDLSNIKYTIGPYSYVKSKSDNRLFQDNPPFLYSRMLEYNYPIGKEIHNPVYDQTFDY